MVQKTEQADQGRKFVSNYALLFLGIAYFFVGLIDLVHTLSYKGMGILPDNSNYATQLWIRKKSCGRAKRAINKKGTIWTMC